MTLSQSLEHLGSKAYAAGGRLFQTNWIIVILLVLAIFFFFFRLGAKSLEDWDEAIHAEVAKQMVIRGEYLTQYHQGELRFEKPPLVPWIMAIFYKTFTINEFWARVPSAISGVLLCIVVFLIGRTVYTAQVGFIAAITMFGMSEVIYYGRFATTDMVLTLFIYVAIFAYLKLDEQQPRWWYIIWLSFAFAFMAKFWAALIIPATLIVALVVDHKAGRNLGSRQFWLGALAAGLVIVPWHLFSYVRHGQQFIDTYFLRNLITRSTNVLDGHVGNKLYFIQWMQRFTDPWHYLLPVAYAIEIKLCLVNRRKSRVLLILSIFTMALYSLIVATKLTWYILPVYPALALFIASTVDKAYKDYRDVAFSGLIFATLVGLLLVSNKIVIIYLLLVLVPAFLIIRYSREIRPYQVATLSMYGFLLVSSIIMNVRGFRQPYSDEQSSISQIAKVVNQQEQMSNDPLLGIALEKDLDDEDLVVYGPTAAFYSNRNVEVIANWDELAETLTRTGERDIIVVDKYLATLSENYEVEVKATIEPYVYATIKTARQLPS